MSEATEEKKVESVDVEAIQKEAELQKQYASQNDANFRKERQRNDELVAKQTESDSKLESLNQQLETLKTQQLNKSQYQPMDKDLVDESVRGNVETLQAQITRLTTQMSEQAGKISAYEKNESERDVTNQRNAVKDELCIELDTKYDPKYRSKAVLMAQEKVDSGTAKPTRDRLDAYRLLNSCYSELAEADKKKDASVTDNGKGSKAPVKNRENKGSLKDVLKDMKKTFKLTKET